ncbi:MAG: EamA family transporter [Defluviitaleaceae bacterium]|nr:EamA family transporter [Defluviitaleaceae bacterium]MCL2835966.1 EamA family transporter [Defluviitaleaceae bacterium]
MENWIIHAAGSAVFAALTTILAKIGLRNVDSHLATAIRTMVVLAFAWLMVLVAGSGSHIRHVDGRTWIFLILSGAATGGSWLCFFRALQLGSVNRVVPIDKSSTILTMILAFIFLREPMGGFTVAGMALMAAGTWLMLDLKKDKGVKNRRGWLFYALLAAVFASLTAVLGRIGIANIEANLGTAIRTMAVVPMSWLMVFITKGQKNIGKIDRRSWMFLLLSGAATGASWLFFYRALQLGNASHVVPIDKLSVVLTMGFARLFLGERFSKRSLTGLALLTAGTLLPIIVTLW